jgi:hypothetical protein
MNKLIILLSLFLVSSTSAAETSLYDELGSLPMLDGLYDVVKTPNGIDLKLKETFENSQGKIEPIAHIELEGPFKNDRFQTLEQGIQYLGEIVRQEVDENYTTKNMMYPGLGIAVVDVNKTHVGLLDYKMNREPDTYVRRAVILTENGLYSYSMSMHKSEPKDKRGLHLMAIVIASVNSGKL